MTVAAGAAKAGPYTGNDVTTQFAFSFRVFADADIQVIETLISTEVESVLVLDTDYTVSRNVDQDNNPGGVVTYLISGLEDALPSTKKLTIIGDFDYEQPTDIPNGGPFLASAVEIALDRVTMLIKQVKERVDRAVTVDVSSAVSPDLLLDTLQADVLAAASSAADAQTAQGLAEAAQALAEAAAANLPNATTGGADKFLQTNATGDGWDYHTASEARTALGLGTAAVAAVGLSTGNVLQANQAVTTVASASSVALATTLEQYITGTVAVTEFTGTAGVRYRCRAAGALPLTHSADLNILQTGASVTLDAGATFSVYMVDANSCLVTDIQLASGRAMTSGIIIGTPVSLSGASVDFPLPSSTAKRVTFSIWAASTDGTSNVILQLGDSGGPETSGYTGATTNQGGTTVTNWSTGAILNLGGAATDILQTDVILTKVDSANNRWSIAVQTGGSDAAYYRAGAGSKALTGELTQLRLTTAGGTAVFDAGTGNYVFEG